MKKLLITIVIIINTSILISSCKSEKTAPQKEEVVTEKVAYQCPMKCEEEKTYDKEGTCPVCNMKLVQKETTNKTEKSTQQ